MQRSARHEQQRRLELIVDRLRKWCQQSRGNLEWAAKQLEVDQSAVSRWVSGRERPCEGNAKAIERFLVSQNGVLSPLERAAKLRLAHFLLVIRSGDTLQMDFRAKQRNRLKT